MDVAGFLGVLIKRVDKQIKLTQTGLINRSLEPVIEGNKSKGNTSQNRSTPSGQTRVTYRINSSKNW